MYSAKRYIPFIVVVRVGKISKSAREFVLHAGDKNSFDIGSGGPEDHNLRFFGNRRSFFQGGLFLPPLVSVL